MRFLGLILGLSVCGLVAGVVLPGWSDLLLLAVPCALAALWLILRHRPPHPGVRIRREAAASPYPMPQSDPVRQIILDGSNVMHWRDGKPDIDTVREVLDHLRMRGFRAGVMFDANAGYLLSDRYRHDGYLAGALGLTEDRVMVVPKGTVADRYILTAARDLGAAIVTDDRYRDWLAEFPEAREPGRLIRGGYRDGTLWIDLPPEGGSGATG